MNEGNLLKSNKKCIPCTVGILTYNSGENLERCLRSIEGVCEIILADGGSADKTLEIGRKYGCKIIKQSDPGHPIVDFALERNRILDAAAHDLIFYLDSDETASPELLDKIKEIASSNMEPAVYWVQYVRTDISDKTIYDTYRETYQPRLFHRGTGARYERPVHERIVYGDDVPVVYIEESWHVPIDVYDFRTYRKKVLHRIPIQAARLTSKSFPGYLKRGLWYPLVGIAKAFFYMLGVRIKYPKTGIPPAYELQRMYSHLAHLFFYARQYVKNLRAP